MTAARFGGLFYDYPLAPLKGLTYNPSRWREKPTREPLSLVLAPHGAASRKDVFSPGLGLNGFFVSHADSASRVYRVLGGTG